MQPSNQDDQAVSSEARFDISRVWPAGSNYRWGLGLVGDCFSASGKNFSPGEGIALSGRLRPFVRYLIVVEPSSHTDAIMTAPRNLGFREHTAVWPTVPLSREEPAL
jgi:hypothetical protein